MNRERIEQWIAMQIRMVEPDGAAACWVEVLAPDEGRVGRFPIDEETTAQNVEALLSLQRAELPTGFHTFTLRSETADGQQLSTLQQTLKGESAQAKTAQGEARELQKTLALAIGNLESVIGGSNDQLERYRTMTDELLGANIQLTQAVREVMLHTQEMRQSEEEHQARMAALGELAKQAEPIVAVLGSFVVDKIGKRMGLNDEDPPKPTNGASVSADRKPESAPDDGRAGDSGGDGPRPGPRRRKSARAKESR